MSDLGNEGSYGDDITDVRYGVMSFKPNQPTLDIY